MVTSRARMRPYSLFGSLTTRNPARFIFGTLMLIASPLVDCRNGTVILILILAFVSHRSFDQFKDDLADTYTRRDVDGFEFPVRQLNGEIPTPRSEEHTSELQ